MQKWNLKEQKYYPYTPPVPLGNYPLVCFDMTTIVNCAECGKKIQYGKGYTSRFIHTSGGMGYCVCESCYRKELQKELQIEKKRKASTLI